VRHSAPRDGEIRIGPGDVLDDLTSADSNLGRRELEVFLRDRRAQVAFAAAWQLLPNREHVHVRVQRIERVQRPLPDLRLETGGHQEPFLSRAVACRFELAAQGDQHRVPRERVVNRGFQTERRAFIDPLDDDVVKVLPGLSHRSLACLAEKEKNSKNEESSRHVPLAKEKKPLHAHPALVLRDAVQTNGEETRCGRPRAAGRWVYGRL